MARASTAGPTTSAMLRLSEAMGMSRPTPDEAPRLPEGLGTTSKSRPGVPPGSVVSPMRSSVLPVASFAGRVARYGSLVLASRAGVTIASLRGPPKGAAQEVMDEASGSATSPSTTTAAPTSASMTRLHARAGFPARTPSTCTVAAIHGSFTEPDEVVLPAPATPPLPSTPMGESSRLDERGSGQAPRKRPRSKAPPIYNKLRGSRTRGLEIAANVDERRLAMEEYQQDKRSAGDTSGSNLTTWCAFHDAWWNFTGQPVPYWPLTPVKIDAVGQSSNVPPTVHVTITPMPQRRSTSRRGSSGRSCLTTR